MYWRRRDLGRHAGVATPPRLGRLQLQDGEGIDAETTFTFCFVRLLSVNIFIKCIMAFSTEYHRNLLNKYPSMCFFWCPAVPMASFLLNSAPHCTSRNSVVPTTKSAKRKSFYQIGSMAGSLGRAVQPPLSPPCSSSARSALLALPVPRRGGAQVQRAAPPAHTKTLAYGLAIFSRSFTKCTYVVRGARTGAARRADMGLPFT